MKPIIKPSSELRKNYNSIASICKREKAPVFLTINGEGDTVIMDIETYSRREEELSLAARLLEAERERLNGSKGYSLEELEEGLEKSIKDGIRDGQKHGV